MGTPLRDLFFRSSRGSGYLLQGNESQSILNWPVDCPRPAQPRRPRSAARRLWPAGRRRLLLPCPEPVLVPPGTKLLLENAVPAVLNGTGNFQSSRAVSEAATRERSRTGNRTA